MDVLDNAEDYFRAAAKEIVHGELTVDELMRRDRGVIHGLAAKVETAEIDDVMERATRQYGTADDVALMQLARPYLFTDHAHPERVPEWWTALSPDARDIVQSFQASQMRIAERMVTMALAKEAQS